MVPFSGPLENVEIYYSKIYLKIFASAKHVPLGLTPSIPCPSSSSILPSILKIEFPTFHVTAVVVKTVLFLHG